MKNSTFVTLPLASVALAVNVIAEFVLKLALLAGAVRDTVGGVFGAVTVILTVADVTLRLRLSVALAEIAYVPAATEFHTKLYGLLVSSPSFVVPLKNSTLETVPSASLAVAVIVMFDPLIKFALFAGPVRLTVGEPLGACTEIDIEDELAIAPSLSVTLAEMEYVPGLTEFHTILYGAVASSPIFVVP